MGFKKKKPGPGQESVWDYPRPPIVQDVPEHIRIVHEGKVLADTNRAKRVLETSHPPVYYLPPDHIDMARLVKTGKASFCEFKGMASYFDLKTNKGKITGLAWMYPDATERFKVIEGYLAFYANLLDECYVGDERVLPQEGNFYGGWITKKVVGPFKGGAGTWGW